MAAIDITINNRDYRLACDDGQEARLQELSDYINQRLAGIVRAMPQAGEKMHLVMLLLTMSDEISELESEVGQLREQAASHSDAFESGKSVEIEKALSTTISRMAERLERITDRLNAA